MTHVRFVLASTDLFHSDGNQSQRSVSDEVMEQLALVMTEYDCDNLRAAASTASPIALERDEAELAQILTDKLSNWRGVIGTERRDLWWFANNGISLL